MIALLALGIIALIIAAVTAVTTELLNHFSGADDDLKWWKRSAYIVFFVLAIVCLWTAARI